MGIYPTNAVVNAIVWLFTGPHVSKGVDIRDDVLACATGIRKSFGKLKDPKFIEGLAADLGKVLSQVAWDKNGQDLATANEGCLMVNNMWG